MLRRLITNYRKRNHFNPSRQEQVSHHDLRQILRGHASNSDQRDSAYFVVCNNGIGAIECPGVLRLDDMSNVIEDVLDRSEWFGKFLIKGQSQIIVPARYDLLIDPLKEQIYLRPTGRACYYGDGNLQYDKDSRTKVLWTTVGFAGLRELVNATCVRYQYADSLRQWD
jgi:hypothetical protein